ncbi:hypothetical protein HanRHA438_Chr08g0341701 [Helianthus annuus]|nr:hypothetical protein HanHA89_Chr08g0290111 [Helianthus annuus]KAJ0718560.1 hypothetical protein HanLR1_Chr08g0271971 [Helianthus annuus]KAJ0897076.1 hypothetical protein HanRHA438_Chr08g0341701 [Helianthus annuus]
MCSEEKSNLCFTIQKEKQRRFFKPQSPISFVCKTEIYISYMCICDTKSYNGSLVELQPHIFLSLFLSFFVSFYLLVFSSLE